MNNFYNDFDIRRVKHSHRENDYRSPFQIDRDRIIYSSEFRRLQGKTQVFLPGEYDFYRTRLTHSIEVAQIGRSICNYLFKSNDTPFNEEYYIDPDLVEASCLAHDLGHPPFGHAGEKVIHRLMKDYGGFEGNAQTLRLITEIFYKDIDKHRSMNPTRAFLDGVLKYKALYSQFENPFNHFLYDSQIKNLAFVFAGKSLNDNVGDVKEINKFRSIECQVMDWADDTAYAVNDLVDSISGGFINIVKLTKFENEHQLTDEEKNYVDEIIEWIKKGNFKAKFGGQIGDFIRACKVVENDTFMNSLTNRYKYKIEIDDTIKRKAEFYKRISVELVFRSPQIHQMEFKGDHMLQSIFRLFHETYVDKLDRPKYLPNFQDKIIRQEKYPKIRARMICDYISGMTDSYAVRIFKRLFDPDYSYLVDFI
ncbi:MAG: dNTP triphosphohydrolase [Ignavibacteria bacterium]|jgi:dGTPase